MSLRISPASAANPATHEPPLTEALEGSGHYILYCRPFDALTIYFVLSGVPRDIHVLFHLLGFGLLLIS